MQETELRALIEDVRTEKLPRRSFIERLVGLGLTAPMASMLLMHAGVAQSQPAPAYKPTKRGGGGALKTLWWQGADAAPAALRQRHQGPGRLARLLRAARRSGTTTATCVPILAAEIPTRRERRRGRRRQVGDLEAEEGRHLARRQALHRRRLSSSPGSSSRDPATAARDDRRLQRPHGRQGRRLHGARRLPEADAVLGHRLRRRRGHDHSRSTCSARTPAPSRATRRPT